MRTPAVAAKLTAWLVVQANKFPASHYFSMWTDRLEVRVLWGGALAVRRHSNSCTVLHRLILDAVSTSQAERSAPTAASP